MALTLGRTFLTLYDFDAKSGTAIEMAQMGPQAASVERSASRIVSSEIVMSATCAARSDRPTQRARRARANSAQSLHSNAVRATRRGLDAPVGDRGDHHRGHEAPGSVLRAGPPGH